MIGPPIRDPREQDRKRKALQAMIAAMQRQGGGASRLSKFARTGQGRVARSSGPLINRSRPIGVLDFLQPRGQGNRGLSHAIQVSRGITGVQRHAPAPLPAQLPSGNGNGVSDFGPGTPNGDGTYAPDPGSLVDLPPIPEPTINRPVSGQNQQAASIAHIIGSIFGGLGRDDDVQLGGGFSVDPNTGRVAGAGRFVG